MCSINSALSSSFRVAAKTAPCAVKRSSTPLAHPETIGMSRSKPDKTRLIGRGGPKKPEGSYLVFLSMKCETPSKIWEILSIVRAGKGEMVEKETDVKNKTTKTGFRGAYLTCETGSLASSSLSTMWTTTGLATHRTATLSSKFREAWIGETTCRSDKLLREWGKFSHRWQILKSKEK